MRENKHIIQLVSLTSRITKTQYQIGIVILVLFTGFIWFLQITPPVPKRFITKVSSEVVTVIPDETFIAPKTFHQLKRQLLAHYMQLENVLETKDLSNKSKLEFAKYIATEWKKEYLNPNNIPKNVYEFLTLDGDPINTIETAIVEELKYGVPASIKLSQAALETGWGKETTGNNWFGIKDKAHKTKPKLTTEIVTLDERNNLIRKGYTIHKLKSLPNGNYKVWIKDSFVEYPTVWHSWVAHSEFLVQNPRYSSLISHGDKDYYKWTKLLPECGYSTAGPLYTKKLINIIEKYNLNTLDLKH